MSSTNRGRNRTGNDFYATPDYTIKSLLDVHTIQYPVLEPCAGNLAISCMLGGGVVMTNDIEPQCRKTDYHSDYRFMSGVGNCEFKTIITTPPFNLAQEIIGEIQLSASDVIISIRDRMRLNNSNFIS